MYRMKLLDSISIRGREHEHVELYQGDLTVLAPTEGFDLLVVCAFPDDYFPTRTSLIGALNRKGLSVARLALIKDIDLRESFSCWLSREFTSQDEGLRFRRILCFEPRIRGDPPELVGDIFRALTPILAEKPDIKTIALPMIAAGNQGCSVAEMMAPLLEAALHWLENGLPLDCIKIVTFSDAHAQDASRIFSNRKAEYSRSTPSAPHQMAYDLFISYARANTGEMKALEQALRRSQPGIRIFLDFKEVAIGSAWQTEIFESLDKCRKVVAMLSPEYLSSKACKEEFNIAWIRSRETDEEIVFPIYIYSTRLPTYMKYWNYFDCREGDTTKIAEAAERLLTDLDTGCENA
jgi:TIR domain